jgi:hypothetical protein
MQALYQAHVRLKEQEPFWFQHDRGAVRARKNHMAELQMMSWPGRTERNYKAAEVMRSRSNKRRAAMGEGFAMNV